MLSIRLDQVVAQIVRHALLLPKGREKEALHLHFDLRLGHYSEGESYSESRGLHLLYHSPFGGYVNVFSAVTDSPFTKIHKVGEWKHESSHDTCWRDIGTFSQVYFDMANCINAQLAEDGLAPIAPKDMHESNSFALLRDELYSWVPVEVTKDPSDTNSYRKFVKVIL